MNEQAFELLVLKLDELKRGQDDIRRELREHNELDMAVHQQVNRHATYFGVLFFGFTTSLSLLVAWIKQKLHL